MISELLQVQQRPFPREPAPGLPLGLVFVSVGLLVALLLVFYSTWRKTKAPFMLGLVIFAGALLLQDVARVAFALGLRVRGLEIFPELLELVALAVLLYLATR